jgi:hypothetical protein
MSTNNVMMTNNDKKTVENTALQKQIKEVKRKLDFVKDVDKLLKKYKLPKDYLYLAAKRSSLNTDRQLYMIEVETFNDGVYDGNVTLIVHGTEDEVKKQKDLLVEKLKEQYKDEPEMTFEDSYYNEVGLPLMLCKR